jgi:hypothetical protein
MNSEHNDSVKYYVQSQAGHRHSLRRVHEKDHDGRVRNKELQPSQSSAISHRRTSRSDVRFLAGEET